MIIYQGWVKPFKLPLQNRQEMTNEVLILLNTYFLFLYSDFVGKPEVRYQMGWVNVGFLGSMVAINLLIITKEQISSILRYFKLKKMKHRHAKLVKKA